MKKQEQNTKETVSMLVYGYLVILFAGLPLYMQNKLVMIGNAKYLFFRNTTLVLGAFVVLAVLWQGIRGERTTKRTWKKTDVFMLLYLVSAIFSYGISPCREDVLLGYPGWYMGLVTQGLLVGIYFAVSRYYDGSRSIWWIAGITAGIVTFIGLLNRLDIDVLGTFRGMENGEWNRTQLLSTIGNNNWYAGYISVTAGISLAAAYMGKRQGRVLGMLGSFLFLASAITSNSTTAIIGSLWIKPTFVPCFSAAEKPAAEGIGDSDAFAAFDIYGPIVLVVASDRTGDSGGCRKEALFYHGMVYCIWCGSGVVPDPANTRKATAKRFSGKRQNIPDRCCCRSGDDMFGSAFGMSSWRNRWK